MFGVIITKLHGRVSHAGRAPRGFDSAKYRQRTIEKEIDKLKEQLNGAVKAENYELAAKLRDKINELKAGGK
jgi:protein arginine kinase activator